MSLHPDPVLPPSPADPGSETVPPPPPPATPATWSPGLGLIACLVGVTCLFASAWGQLIADAIRGKALHAYAAGIPAICVWLYWQRRQDPIANLGRPQRGWALVTAAAAAVAGIGTLLAWRAGIIQHPNSWLAGQTLGWVLAVWAALLGLVPSGVLKLHRFAVLFLVFTIPLPESAVNTIEIGLQNASAHAVEIVFRMGGVPYIRDSREFALPGLRFVVAQECSGIRSTLVLFITSILGGHLLLRSFWRKTVIALCIVPLGIARNAFRICTITLLTVHVDPGIIDSPLHHRGGPLFFAVTLVPLFALLWWFRRQERTPSPPATPP